MTRGVLGVAGLAAALVLFFAVNILAGAGLGAARLDLTEGRLYTLTAASGRIAAQVAEPIRLTFYYTSAAATGRPDVQAYAVRVRDTLAAYQRASRGKVSVVEVDPEPYTEDEEAAQAAGLVGVPTGSGTLFFGLVGTNSTDGREVVRFFSADREQFLEYELSRLIYTLDHPVRPAVGLMSTLPLDGMPTGPMMQAQPRPAWQVHSLMRQLFDLRQVSTLVTDIPADIGILVVVHPKSLPDQARYAIDQFVLRGGRLVVFADPHCDAEAASSPQDFSSMMAPRDSDLPDLFAAWGVELAPDVVAADASLALAVVVGTASRPETVDFVTWLGLKDDALDRDDPVTGQLSQVNVASAGVLRARPGATTTLTPLLTTSPKASELGVEKVRLMPDPKALRRDFVEGTAPLTISARITGPAKSAFAARPNPSTPELAPENPPAHLAESAQDISVVVVADADLLDDSFWVRAETLFGQVVGYSRMADNGDFLIGLLDQMSGSRDLIDIRARARFSRPFTRVEDIRRAAQQSTLDEQEKLEQQIRDTEQRLLQLQSARTDGGDELLVTPEQRAEIERLRGVIGDTRKEQRALQAGMNRDIERLGNRLKFANIGLVPIVLSAAAVTLGASRVARRRPGARPAAKE